MNYTTALNHGIKTYAEYMEEARNHHYTSPEILTVHDIIMKTLEAMSVAYPSGGTMNEQDEKRVTDYVANRFRFYGEEGVDGSEQY